MTSTGTLAERLGVLLFLTALGFVLGRRKGVKKESMANVLIYGTTPIVVFHGVWQRQLNLKDLLIPLVGFLLSSALCLLTFIILRKTPSPKRNILAFAAGNANSGYIGLPVAIAIFGEAVAPLAILISFGFILFENTVGYFVTARGHYSVGDSFRRVFRLPGVYAFLLATMLSLGAVGVPDAIQYLGPLARGAYSVLGMMLLGVALSELKSLNLDWDFLSKALASKFVVWPISVLVLTSFFRPTLVELDPKLLPVVQLFGVLPMAANTVAFATELRAEPEKSAMAVLSSTFISFAIILLARPYWGW
jgi:predicted permease